MERKCKENLKILCYQCGLHTPKDKQKIFTETSKSKYYEKFNQLPLLDENYTPLNICSPCFTMLMECRPSRRSTKLLSPVIWRAPDTNHEKCYGCLMPSLKGSRWCNRHRVEYPTTSTSTTAVWRNQENQRERSPHPPSFQEDVSPEDLFFNSLHSSSLDNPIPSPTREMEEGRPSSVLSMESMDSLPSSHSSGTLWEPEEEHEQAQPILMNQTDFRDLCLNKLRLNKDQTEVLGSTLRAHNFLAIGVITTFLRNDKSFSEKFQENIYNWAGVFFKIAFLADLDGLFAKYGLKHKASEWRLFIDGSTTSLKAMLLHNGNIHPSIPLAYCRKLPESYENMKHILELINYNDHQWQVILDFKLINIIAGLGPAQSKYPCFLCLWDKNHKHDKYDTTEWTTRPEFGR